MTTLKERAVDMISRMPEEKLYYVVQFLESVEGLGGYASKGVMVPEQRGQEDLQRFHKQRDVEIDHELELGKAKKGKRVLGLANGKYVIPDDIDECNEEISEMFGVEG